MSVKGIYPMTIILGLTAGYMTVLAQPTSGLSRLATPTQESPSSQHKEVSENELLQQVFQASPEANVPAVKAVFEEEVLQSSKWFMTGALKEMVDDPNPIHDDHAEVEVDQALLWRYLKFSASGYQAQESNGKVSICMQMRAESGCALCDELKTQLYSQLMDRFTRRGFFMKAGPAILTPLTAQTSTKGDRAFEEYAGRISSSLLDSEEKTNCDGLMYSEIFRDPSSGFIRTHTTLSLKNLSGMKSKGTVETIAYPGEATSPTKAKPAFKSAQSLARKIGTHQVVSLFGLNQSDSEKQIARGKSEVLAAQEAYIEVMGVNQFSKYQNFKQAFEEAYPQFALEERTMGAGIFKFAVKGLKGAQSTAQETALALDSLAQRFKQSPYVGQKGLRIEIVRKTAENKASGEEKVTLSLK